MTGTFCVSPQRMKCLHAYSTPVNLIVNLTTGRPIRCYLNVIPEDRYQDTWIAASWKQEWEASGPPEGIATYGTQVKTSRGKTCVENTELLNRLPTGVGRYRSSMKKWGLVDSVSCECG